MLKKSLVLFLACSLFSSYVLADQLSDQEYINRLNYQRNKLELITRQREIAERSSYSYTDIDSYTYTYEASARTSIDISTQTHDRSEKRAVTDWYIYKGRFRKINDLEFLALVGDQAKLALVLKAEKEKARLRGFGNILIGSGLLVMLGGSALSAPAGTVTAGALGMVAGFFINAFNLSPRHYIEPDYAQEKIDEYNIGLKRKLRLPLSYN